MLVKLTPSEQLQWKSFLNNLTSYDPKSGHHWVDPSLLRRWFEMIVKKMEKNNLEDDDVKKVEVSPSGPAMKLTISVESLPKPIYVDLVPVFQFFPDVLFNVPEKNLMHEA